MPICAVNILLIRGKISVHPDYSMVTHDQIVSYSQVILSVLSYFHFFIFSLLFLYFLPPPPRDLEISMLGDVLISTKPQAIFHYKK
jgi:hypothetical protein